VGGSEANADKVGASAAPESIAITLRRFILTFRA